jgi:hypothetical protein
MRVVYFLRSSNSFCFEDQQDSIIAFSNESPTEPNDGIRPAARTLSVNAQEVN